MSENSELSRLRREAEEDIDGVVREIVHSLQRKLAEVDAAIAKWQMRYAGAVVVAFDKLCRTVGDASEKTEAALVLFRSTFKGASEESTSVARSVRNLTMAIVFATALTGAAAVYSFGLRWREGFWGVVLVAGATVAAFVAGVLLGRGKKT